MASSIITKNDGCGARRDALVYTSTVHDYAPDEPVFEVGDRMDGFYVLVEGAVSAYVDGHSVWACAGPARANFSEDHLTLIKPNDYETQTK